MKAIRILIFVIIMGTVASGLLVAVNAFTTPLIAKNEEIKLKSAILDVLEISYIKENVLEIFDEQVQALDKEGNKFYKAVDGTIAFQFRGPGLWGPIAGIISLEKDLKTIRQIKITYQEETPGLGGRIAEANFLKQFKHKESLPRIVFMPEGKASLKNEVDAITGATGSSRALEKLLNENVQKNLELIKQ